MCGVRGGEVSGIRGVCGESGRKRGGGKVHIHVYVCGRGRMVTDMHSYNEGNSGRPTLNLLLLLHPLLAKFFPLLSLCLLHRAWQNSPISSQNNNVS